MIIQAVDKFVTLDTGMNNPDAIIQRKGPKGWSNYMPHGVPMGEPKKIDSLPPGEYRLVESPGTGAPRS